MVGSFKIHPGGVVTIEPLGNSGSYATTHGADQKDTSLKDSYPERFQTQNTCLYTIQS